jgi:hypothetical protein
MNVVDAVGLYLCFGLALFFSDLLFEPSSEWRDLWRVMTGADSRDLGLVVLAASAVLGVCWVIAAWSLLWPFKVLARLRASRSRR